MTDTASQTEALLALLARHGIGDFFYRDETLEIRVSGGAIEAPPSTPSIEAGAPTAPSDAHLPRALRSPGVGRFQALSRDAVPRLVRKGEILGTLAAGLTLMPVVAPGDGELVAIRHADGTGVGYDTPLFDIL